MLPNGIVIARRGEPLPMAFVTLTATEHLEALPCDRRPTHLRWAPSAATGCPTAR